MSSPPSLPRASDAGPDASAAQLTVYFDGGCPVCSREIAMYRAQPGADACRWVDASSCGEEALGAGLTRDTALARFHVRRADGQLVDGMRGFATLWQTLPRTAWLGRIASLPPVPALLDAAYAAFLALRRLWRPARADAPWPAEVIGDLRSDHAGEVGAVQIYRGILAVSKDDRLCAFAERHLLTEQEHLRIVVSHLPAAHHSRLLPAWRVAGWLTGALPACFGPGAVYATVAAVETFVDRHYAEQVARLDALPFEPRRAALREDLERCRLDELAHREDARQSGPATSWPVRAWTWLVASGSAAAVALARRL